MSEIVGSATFSLPIVSAFSGIGGLEWGLEMAGVGHVVVQCELDPHCRHVLQRHWPHARRYRYVQGLAHDAAAHPDRFPRDSLFCGGFPCQDISQANPDGKGLDGERSGLFWWALDVIDALDPLVVVVENVGRLVGRDLDRVVGEFERRRFHVEAARIMARAVGAPHRRERVFVVGYSDRLGRHDWAGEGSGSAGVTGPLGAGVGQANTHVRRREGERLAQPAGERCSLGDKPVRRDGTRADVADPDGVEPQRGGVGRGMGGAPCAPPGEARQQRVWGTAGDGGASLGVALGNPDSVGLEGVHDRGATPGTAHGADGARPAGAAEPRLGGDPDGLPCWLDATHWPAARMSTGQSPQWDWEPPRVVPHYRGRRERLKGCGNAVVPQVAYVVGLRVRQMLDHLAHGPTPAPSGAQRVQCTQRERHDR